MKNKLILVGAIMIVLVSIVVYGYFQTPKESVPKQDQKFEASIKIEPSAFDFGTVVYGVISEHKFIIKNEGTANLQILRLSTSCGCTKATIEENDKTIAPGKSVEMKVTFDPAVHKDDTDLGALTRTIYVKSNDPVYPETETTITAFVVKNKDKEVTK